jgi:hypothetical protein
MCKNIFKIILFKNKQMSYVKLEEVVFLIQTAQTTHMILMAHQVG